ncbi:MAG: HD domain-containing phosphohydrolase [Oscillospiraceae bacterium]
MKNKAVFRVAIFVFICFVVNYAGKLSADLLSFPIWLDSIGTVFGAYYLGPVCGAIIGATTNIMYSFYSPIALCYVLTNISVGFVVGISAKKGFLKDMFGVLSTAFVVTLVSVSISTPLNIITMGGKTGNMWGDGVIELFQKLGMNKVLSSIAGEYYIDFLDKTLSLLLLYAILRIKQAKPFRRISKEKKNHSSGSKVLPMVLVCLFTVSSLSFCNTAYAAESGISHDDYSFKSYIHTIYNGENGLAGGRANDIVQTKDGVIWIATYGGLYRYCGNEMKWMNELESVKTVNCLYTDEAGRMWIGTNDNGLSIYMNDRITNVLNKNDGFPSNSVRCITESSKGLYYAGTTDSLVVLTLSGGLKVYDIIPEIVYAKSISADAAGNVAVVSDDGVLYLVRGVEIVSKLDKNNNGERFTCCSFNDEGVLYAGSSGNTVTAFEVSDNGFTETFSLECGELSALSSLDLTDDGTLFVCADNGAGYITTDNRFGRIEMNSFNSSIEHMLKDYQGNYWFASSRLGLMCFCKTVFTEIGQYDGLSGNVVNTVTIWQDVLYAGTDNGLDAIGENETGRKLAKELEGVRIRCFTEDSYGNLWICTSGKGIWRVSPDGTITEFNSSVGTAGDKFRSAIETDDGIIVAAGDYGITYIKDGSVIRTITSADGLSNPKVLSLVEREDGVILAGTDGNGIAVIKDGAITGTIKQEDGLSSETILRIVNNSEENGCFVVTGNGISYIDSENKVRVLNNFPYYNNFDIVEGTNGELFVLSSAGIFVVDKTELLNGGAVKHLLLNSKNGLQSALTPNSWNYIDENDNLYLSTDTGIVFFNMNRYDIPMRSCRMLLKEIQADGEIITIEKGIETVIPAGTNEIVFTPEIVNFSVNDPDISVYMEGLDMSPKIMSQSEITSIVYSNLPSGKYVFHLAILDNRTGDVLAENTYRLSKEPDIFEHWWFRLYIAVVAVITVAYLTWLIVRTQIQKTLRMQKMELDFAKNQVRMGNETIITIARTVDAKDENTSQHSVRVAEYSVMIAKKLGYADDECENLRKTAMLHDIGKIGIPDSVLNKPARLTDEEYAIMKSHVTRGAEILKNFTMIENVAEGALYHHERYDGRGYASGLKGEEIPLNARIIGIADAFDAMTANRVYRKKLDLEYVINELKKGRGTQFDPKLADIMLELIGDGTIDVEQIYGKKLGEELPDEK